MSGKEMVQAYLEQDKAPNSMIFFGDMDEANKTAVELAMALNCMESEDKAASHCGMCLSCTKITNKTHPDVHIVDWEYQMNQEGKSSVSDQREFKIDTMRSLERKLRFPPLEGKAQVAIINPAHMLNEAAANALLKLFEEPPSWVYIILICDDPNKLLQTIRSRAQFVRFTPGDLEAKRSGGETLSSFRARPLGEEKAGEKTSEPLTLSTLEEIMQHAKRYGEKNAGRSMAEETVRELLEQEEKLLHKGDMAVVKRIKRLNQSLFAIQHNVAPRLVMETLFFERLAQ